MHLRLFLVSLGLVTSILADETKWIAVGNVHNWYSSAGAEREVGRTGLVSDQQDGLRWPAQFRWQDTKVAKAMWIGATNYRDPLIGKTFDYKVVHVGPRVLDDTDEIMPVEFKMVARHDHPSVFVDGDPGSNLMVAMDEVDEVDPTLKADRMIYNVVHTAMGITLTRKIYAFTNPYHDNYFIYDYVFKNTGIVKKDTSVTHSATLTGVVFFFQYRYAPTREGSVYGGGWLPQSASWGHNTVNDAIFTHPETGEPFRVQFAWQGLHSQAAFSTIGGPAATGDGHLTSTQYVGVVTLHADRSASDKSDDPAQPFTTMYLQSDLRITSGNSQFNDSQMAAEYEAMTDGHPAKRHGEDLGCPTPIDCSNPANTYVKAGDPGNPGGYTHGQGFGPYTLEPGDEIHIVLAEGVAGINREMAYVVGGNWLKGGGPFDLPEKVGGGTTSFSSGSAEADYYKNAWVYTGEDSLFQTFERAISNFESDFGIPQPPPPPELFQVNSGGDRNSLTWSDNAETDPVNPAVGYRIYRAIHVPDTTYELIFECGQGTPQPIVHEYDDTRAIRGFNYYYYIVSFDDGSANDLYPGVPLVSSKFFTMTSKEASPVLDLEPSKSAPTEFTINKVYPNPFNPTTTIEFSIAQGGLVIMTIYDLLGREVETILNQRMDAGHHKVEWNASNVPSGIYFVRMEVGDPSTGSGQAFTQTRKLTVLR